MLMSWGIRPGDWLDVPYWERQFIMRHWSHSREEQQKIQNPDQEMESMNIDPNNLPPEIRRQL